MHPMGMGAMGMGGMHGGMMGGAMSPMAMGGMGGMGMGMHHGSGRCHRHHMMGAGFAQTGEDCDEENDTELAQEDAHF